MNYEYMTGLGADAEASAPAWAVNFGRQIVAAVEQNLSPGQFEELLERPVPPEVINGNGAPVVNGNGAPPTNGNGITTNGAPVTNGAVTTNGAVITNGNGAAAVTTTEEKKYFGLTAMQLALLGGGGIAIYMLLK